MLERLLIYYARVVIGPELTSAIFVSLSCNNCSSTDAMLFVVIAVEFRKFVSILSAIVANET